MRVEVAVLMSLMVSVDVKQHSTMLTGIGHSLSLIIMSTDIHIPLAVTLGCLVGLLLCMFT